MESKDPLMFFMCMYRYNKKPKFLVDKNCHPQTISVIETRARSDHFILSLLFGFIIIIIMYLSFCYLYLSLLYIIVKIIQKYFCSRSLDAV